MSKIKKKLAKLAADGLGADEQLVAGVRVNLKGTALGAGIAGGIGGIAGIAIGSKIMDQGRDDADGINFTQQMALGLTDRRVIVWERSQLSGKPTKILGHIALADISDAGFEKGKLGDGLTLTMVDGDTLELEAVKVDKGKDFADRLKAAIA